MAKRVDMQLQQEFGFVLHVGIPHMNYMVQLNNLKKEYGQDYDEIHTHSFPGTSCFYYWSDNHHDDMVLEDFSFRDSNGKICHVDAGNRGEMVKYWEAVGSDMDNWGDYYDHDYKMEQVKFPNFKEHFSKMAIENNIDEAFLEKPLCVINNKSTEEQGEMNRALNRIEKDKLKFICDTFGDTHTVVYFRAEFNKKTSSNESDKNIFKGKHSERGYVVDDAFQIEWDEKEWLKEKYPDVILDNDLLDKFKNFNYNEIQCMIHSLSETHFSVPGGTAVLASYFGGTNIIIGEFVTSRGIWKNDSHLKLISGSNIIGLTGREEEKNVYDNGWKTSIQDYYETLNKVETKV